MAVIIEDRGLRRGDPVALLVNGLGGTPPMELAIIARRAIALLRERGMVVERAWAGEFLTALEMPGCSLSVLRLDAARLALLDAPGAAPAWPGPGRIAPRAVVPAPPRAAPAPVGAADPTLRAAVMAVAAALEAAEIRLTELDSAAGDGDLGLSMLRGAAALRALPDAAWTDPPTALAAMGEALRRAIAGSSGPFYATALLRAARGLPAAPGAAEWAAAFSAGVAAIAELGGARAGDRTMLDALLPAAAALATGGLAAAADAAEAGVAATARMLPKLGRASYLGDRALGVPDAGAAAVAVWLRALAGPWPGRPPA